MPMTYCIDFIAFYLDPSFDSKQTLYIIPFYAFMNVEY